MRKCYKRKGGEECPTYNKKTKDYWIGHILRRNCPLKHIIEGEIKGRTQVTGRRVRTRKQLLDNFQETRK